MLSARVNSISPELIQMQAKKSSLPYFLPVKRGSKLDFHNRTVNKKVVQANL